MIVPEFLSAGDLLFFYGRGWQSRAIECATWGPSHVGMIFEYPCCTNGRKLPLLLESTTLCDLPCCVRGRKVHGVQAHGPEDRIRAYDGDVYYAPIRWGAAFRNGQSHELTELIWEEFFTNTSPTPYDLAGALESLTVLPWLKYPDAGSQFCSALVSELLMDFSKLNREPSHGITPAGLKRRIRRQGTHGKPQLVSKA